MVAAFVAVHATWRYAAVTELRGGGSSGGIRPAASGDAGVMMGAARNQSSPFELPFTIGLVPLLFQNGIWMEDAVTGAAVAKKYGSGCPGCGRLVCCCPDEGKP